MDVFNALEILETINYANRIQYVETFLSSLDIKSNFIPRVAV